MSVGFIVGDISNPLMSAIGLAAESRLAKDDYSVLLANSSTELSSDWSNIVLLRQRLVDGLLLSITDETDKRISTELRKLGKPTVLLDRELATRARVGSVYFDHNAGFTQATEHLVSLGHRNVALIAGSPNVRPTRERVAAVESVMRSARGRAMVLLGSLARAEGYNAANRLLGQTRPPTAIICAGNQLLAGVLEAIRARGLSIPEDVSVVTTDAVELAEFHEPPIAAIDRDPQAFGVAAAEILLDMLGGKPAGPPAILPTRFEPTPSCAAPR